MFQIKICGVTNREDAEKAVELGADIVGLNFFSGSPRSVSVEQAQAIAVQLPLTAGVFVNETAERINEISAAVGLDWIQLHGDEPAEFLSHLIPELPIIRVYSVDERGFTAVAEDLADCRRFGREPAAVLVDATVAGQYGGTGKTANWTALANHHDWLGEIPLILAGGLTAENVAQAIGTVRPTGVDTASGVESSPGTKDHQQLQAFISAARSAFDELSSI